MDQTGVNGMKKTQRKRVLCPEGGIECTYRTAACQALDLAVAWNHLGPLCL